ncbi:MAG: aminopeptidase P family protein [Planctomycetes bacterium]|nr:aminopeptidase P family protein [Planctomycetota bacterium]
MHAPDRRRFLHGLAATAAGVPLAACAARGAGPSPGSVPASTPVSTEDGAAGGARAADQAAARVERFAHLADQRGSVAPIAPSERIARRARLSRTLAAAGLDAILVEPGATLTWLTGVTWGRSERLFAYLGTADGEHRWLVPAFEEGRARRQIDAQGGPGGALITWQEHERAERVLAAYLAERRIERVAMEPQLRFVFADRLGAAHGRERIVAGHTIVFALRAQKDAHELAILRRASELTQLAIREVAATLAPGDSGAEVAARLAAAHERLGMRSPWTLALVDAAAALPHGDDHHLTLERGSALLVDTGASLHGYQSDTTRTWFPFAAPRADVERAWQAVRAAQARAFETIAPGVLARAVDARARAALVESGYPGGYAALTHRLGHGIGLEGHEDPYFDGGSEVVLAPGMTLSDEPGIYVVGSFGVRIEDIVTVTETGADHFGEWQTSVRSPA